MPIDDFSNAGAVLFRVFVELSIDHYMEVFFINSVNVDSILVKKVEAIKIDVKSRTSLNKHFLTSINKALTDSCNLLSINTLNAYMHNKNFAPTSNSLKTSWDNIQPFIEKIWELIEKEEKKDVTK